MRILFLPSTSADLAWMRNYYRTVFPAGNVRAAKRYHAALNTLSENPQAGAVSNHRGDLRDYPISQTPFTLVYYLTKTEIRIVRVRDQRALIQRYPPG